MKKRILSIACVLSFALLLIAVIVYVPGLAASNASHGMNPSSSKDILEKHEEEHKKAQAIESYKMGLQYCNTGQIDKGIEEYKKALLLDPNLAEAHLNLGWSYALKRQDYGIALQETLEAIRIKPDLNIAYRNLWWIYRLKEDYGMAMETLKKIIRIEPDNAINYLNLGDAYVTDNTDLDLAVSTYKKGLELDPNNVYLHRKLGKAYEFLKKYDLAKDHLKKALNIAPKDSYSYLFLAVTLGKAGKGKEIPPLMKEGYETIKKTLLYPDRWDLSLLLYFAGDLSEEDLLKKSALDPKHKCEALYYTGLRRIWEGNRAKGIESLRQCRSMHIDALAEYEYTKTELLLLSKEPAKTK